MLIQIRLDEVYEPILVERIEKKDIISVLQSTELYHTTYVVEIADSDFNNYTNMGSADFELLLESDDASIAKFYNGFEE